MTEAQQAEALHRSGMIALRLSRKGDKKAAGTIRALQARIAELEAEVDAERRHHGIRNASAVRTLHALGYSWRGTDAWQPPAPQAVQAAVPIHELKAILADADIGPPVDTDWCCLECGQWTPWHHPEAHDHEDGCSAPSQYAQRRNWKARLSALIAAAPAHPAEGVQAQTMQASEGIEDVAVMEHPEWMLVHKETGAQKPLDSQWTVRATQPATQGMEAHEFVLGVAGLLPDPRDGEFFRWLTGDHESAETRIACASLIGRMSVMSTSAVRADIANAIAAQAKQGGASNDAT